MKNSNRLSLYYFLFFFCFVTTGTFAARQKTSSKVISKKEQKLITEMRNEISSYERKLLLYGETLESPIAVKKVEQIIEKYAKLREELYLKAGLQIPKSN